MMRKILICAATALLVACGGGAAPVQAEASPVLVGVYGDSLTYGTVAGYPSNRLDVPPVRRMNEQAAGWQALDYSLPGATSGMALAGGYGMPFGPFAQHIADAPERLVLLRYGGADALLGVAADEFEANTRQLVVLARGAGKTVALVGIILTSPTNPAVDANDATLRRLAAEMAVPFIDVRALPFSPADLGDGLHPNQGYSDRIAVLMAARITALLR